MRTYLYAHVQHILGQGSLLTASVQTMNGKLVDINNGSVDQVSSRPTNDVTVVSTLLERYLFQAHNIESSEFTDRIPDMSVS